MARVASKRKEIEEDFQAPLFMFLLKVFAGVLSDKIRFLGETNKLRMFNSISFFGGAAFMSLLAFFPTAHPYVCILLFDATAGTIGFSTGGFFKVCSDQELEQK